MIGKGCNGPLVCLLGMSILLNTVVLINQERQRSKSRGPADAFEESSLTARSSRAAFGSDDRVLITGAAGFIGMHTGLRLVQSQSDSEGVGLDPKNVIGVDSFDDYYSVQLKVARSSELRAAGIAVLNVSVCDSDAMARLFQQHYFTHIIHLAAQPGVRYGRQRPDKYMKNNLECFDILLELIRRYRPHAYLVFASSSSVYGANTKMPFSERDRVDQPMSLYGATKRANELLAYTYFHSYGLHSTGLRFFTVYGEWGRPDMAAFKFAYFIDNGIPLNLFERGNFKRDFTYVGDIVEGIVLSCQYRAALVPQAGLPSSGRPRPEIFNLGNSEPVILDYFINLLEHHLNKSAIRKDGGKSAGEVAATHADVRKAAALLGWKPRTSIEVGLEKVALWYRSQVQAGTIRNFISFLDEGEPEHKVENATTNFTNKAPEHPGSLEFIMGQLVNRPTNEVASRKSLDKQVIAVVTGTTSRGLKTIHAIESHPLLTQMIPSLLATVEEGFEYWVYVGYDQFDPLFDSDDSRSQTRQAFELHAAQLLQAKKIPIQFVFLRFSNPQNKPGPVFNFVSAAAFSDGADYLFRVNDDVNFETPWAQQMVDTLSNFAPPNLGVVGPTCSEGNRKNLAFDFTHRTHQIIFGTHYPPELTDWWLDDWISTIYSRYNTVHHPNVRVRHATPSKGQSGRRYTINWGGKGLLDSAIQKSRATLDSYFQRMLETECIAFRENNHTRSYKSILAVATGGENQAQDTGVVIPDGEETTGGGVVNGEKTLDEEGQKPNAILRRTKNSPTFRQRRISRKSSHNNTLLIHEEVNNTLVIQSVLRVSRNSMYSPPWVIVMVVNSGIITMALNWICNIQNLGLWRVLESTLFVALDTGAFDLLNRGKHNTVFWKAGATDWQTKQTYGSASYFTLIHFRQKLILDLLHQNVSILVAEPDATWYGDLIEFVESDVHYKTADVMAYNDSESDTSEIPCGGLLFLRTTEKSKELLQTLNSRHKSAMLKHNGVVSEQSILRKVWRTVKGNFKILPRTKFSSGMWYRRKKSNSTGLLYIHANFMMGVDTKINKMQSRGQWFLDSANDCQAEPT